MEGSTYTDADVRRHEEDAEKAQGKYREILGKQVLAVYRAIFEEARDFMDDDYAVDTAQEAVKNYLSCVERDG